MNTLLRLRVPLLQVWATLSAWGKSSRHQHHVKLWCHLILSYIQMRTSCPTARISGWASLTRCAFAFGKPSEDELLYIHLFYRYFPVDHWKKKKNPALLSTLILLNQPPSRHKIFKKNLFFFIEMRRFIGIIIIFVRIFKENQLFPKKLLQMRNIS